MNTEILCIGSDDEETLEQVVGKFLIEKKLSISLAESCTGGLVSSRLTDIPGSSSYIKLNFVTYSNEAKINVLGVEMNTINTYGAVSDKTALLMSQGVKKVTGSDIGLSITGIAGPSGGSKLKPVGLSYISVCNCEKSNVYKVNINSLLTRKQIKYLTSQYALNYLRLFLIENYYSEI